MVPTYAQRALLPLLDELRVGSFSAPTILWLYRCNVGTVIRNIGLAMSLIFTLLVAYFAMQISNEIARRFRSDEETAEAGTPKINSKLKSLPIQSAGFRTN